MQKKQLQNDIEKNKRLAERLERRLKEEFEEVLDNPTEKRQKRYKEVEAVLLAWWLKETYSNIAKYINLNIADGKSVAVSQLRGKGFSKEDDNTDLYSSLASLMKESIKADLKKIADGIQANSRKTMLDLTESFIRQKKRLTEGFYKAFKKYGIGYFTDRRGAKWTLSRYVEMATTTVLTNANRQAFFIKSLEWGNDLVKVRHLGITPSCPLCEPFENKVLSISGKTKGYMSVYEASQSGHLFGYNCDHIPDELELAPEREDGDNKIALNEANLKYLSKNGIKNIKKRSFYMK